MIETTRPDTPPVATIVVSRPSTVIRAGGVAKAACPSIAVVTSFGDGLTTLNQLARLHPGLLVIDSNLLEEEVDALIAAVRVRQPDIRCLVLVQYNVRHDQLMANGADTVILRNGSAQDLQQALFRLAHGRMDKLS